MTPCNNIVEQLLARPSSICKYISILDIGLQYVERGDIFIGAVPNIY